MIFELLLSIKIRCNFKRDRGNEFGGWTIILRIKNATEFVDQQRSPQSWIEGFEQADDFNADFFVGKYHDN